MRSIVIALALAACGGKPSAPAETFETRGRVERVTDAALDIHHESIAKIRTFDGKLGPMMSMTMPFGTNGVATSGIAKGDAVHVVFSVHYDADPTLRIEAIDKLPADTKLDLP